MHMLEKLTKKIREMEDIDNEYVVRRIENLLCELHQRGVHCIDKFVRKLIEGANSKESYLDILMEGRFAKILARNGFSKIYIEYCKKGPDLKACWNRNTIYFEVRRRHPNEADSSINTEPSFVSSERPENIISIIQREVKHFQDSDLNIIVVWSDTITLERIDMEEAFKFIKQEIEETPEKYNALSGVLITESGGVNTGTFQQFYLFTNDKASKPIKHRLSKKLQSLHEYDKKKLRKDWCELMVALEAYRKI